MRRVRSALWHVCGTAGHHFESAVLIGSHTADTCPDQGGKAELSIGARTGYAELSVRGPGIWPASGPATFLGNPRSVIPQNLTFMDAAWISAGLALAGVLLSQVLNLVQDGRRMSIQVLDRQRDREHERELRLLEIEQSRQVRRYADRRAAYAEFHLSFARLSRLSSEWFHLQGLVESAERNPDLYEVEDVAKHKQRFNEIDMRIERVNVDDALDRLATVASSGVHAAAVVLHKQLEPLISANADLHDYWSSDGPAKQIEWVERLNTVHDDIKQAEAAFHEAVRAELDLDNWWRDTELRSAPLLGDLSDLTRVEVSTSHPSGGSL